MKPKLVFALLALTAITVGFATEPAHANVRLPYPEAVNGPPLFAFPVYEPDQKWTPILFYRNPADIGNLLPDTNLFDLQFDAWNYPLLGDGFVIFTEDFIPMHEEFHGIDMPIWFVPTEEFEDLLTYDEFGNPVFTVADLGELSSVRKGTAIRHVETSHFFGGAEVPFAELQSQGFFEDGGTFTIHLSEAWLPPDGEHRIFHYEIDAE